jgi:hypothetical protein
MDCRGLPPPIRHLVEPSRQTVDDKASVVHLLTRRHDVPVSSRLRSVVAKMKDRLLLLFGEVRAEEEALEKTTQG